MKLVRFSLITLLLVLFVSCSAGTSSDNGNGDGDSNGDHDSVAGGGDKDADKGSDGDIDNISDSDKDAYASETEHDADKPPVDGDEDKEADHDAITDGDTEPDRDADINENCVCDPSDALSCGPGYHCSEDCMRCELDNPPDEDAVDGDLDHDNAQPDYDHDPLIDQDKDSDTSPDDHDHDPDVDINQSCSGDDNCPYGSYCNFETTVPQCSVDCVDNIDCVACCDKALGRCGECPAEPDADPDNDSQQTYTCPGGQTSECPAGYYCLPNGYCDRECDALNPCENPYVCNAHGQCVISMGDEDI